MTKIMTQVIGRDGVSRKNRGVKVVNGLVDSKYKYRSDRVFYTKAWMLSGLLPLEIRIPTLMYNEDEIEPVDVRGETDFSKRTIEKTADEFGCMLEDGAFALYELLRKKSTNNENMLLAMVAGVLAINVLILLGMFG